MKTVDQFLKDLWRNSIGLDDLPEPIELPSDKVLREQQMSKPFIRLMENRMIMGTFRYGRWQDNKSQGIKYDRIESVLKRLHKYQKDGNDEHLVDIANLLMIEFEIGTHPLKHFGSVDDCAEHVIIS